MTTTPIKFSKDISDDLVFGEPSTAYANFLDVVKRVCIEMADRHSEVMPGLKEHAQDNLVVGYGGTRCRAYGTFLCGAWQHEGRPVDEIHLNADFREGYEDRDVAEHLAVTIAHEMVHMWCSLNDIQDCSNRGRYHNKRFGMHAVQMGLAVRKHRSWGVETPGFQPSGRELYADLIAELDSALVIVREPEMVRRTKKPTAAASSASVPASVQIEPKYVFASCKCQTKRGPVTLRMAQGSWREDVEIFCSACLSAFEERQVSTNEGQLREGGV